jgi:iron complex outermembrane receptor protein
VLAVATALGTASMGSALAQETPAPAPAVSATGVEEVVVTARRREESLQDVPIAVTALSGDQLAESQILAVKDVAAVAPGLNINSDSVGRAFISIRGVGTTLIDSVQPGVGIFFDGIYQPNTSYLNSPIVDIARIEVLRGPQGTLFGNNTLGGAINVVTRKPDDEFRGRVDAAWADPDNYHSASLSLSGPIVPGTLQGRVAAAWHEQDGFQDNTLIGGHTNPLEQKSVHGTLRWEATEGVEFNLNAYWDEVAGGNTAYQYLSGPDDYHLDNQLNYNSFAKFTYKGANLKGEFDIGASNKLTVIGAYDKRDQEVTPSDGDYGPFDYLKAEGTGDLETKTGEVRLDTNWNDNVSTLFGLFASNTSNELRSVTTLVPLALSVPGGSKATSDFQGVFGNVFWKFADTWELSAGLRYDHQKVEITTSPDTYDTDEWEPRLSLTKHWSDAVMTYASVARGFRGGGTNGPGAPNPIYKGDSVWTYELGTKSVLLDQKLALNAAIFYNDYSDFIGQNGLAPSVSGPGFVAINLNSGDAKSYGAEFEAHLNATERLQFDAGVTLLHARVTDDSQYQELIGYPLPSDHIIFTPDWNYNLGGTYRLPLFEGRDSLDFSASVVGKGTRMGSGVGLPDLGDIKMEAYNLVNASITYRFPNVEIALFGTNITDEKYLESYIDHTLLESIGIFPPPLVHNLGIQGERRRVGLRATWRF